MRNLLGNKKLAILLCYAGGNVIIIDVMNIQPVSFVDNDVARKIEM